VLAPGDPDPEARTAAWADLLLARYGVLFKELLDEETASPPWRELLPVLRRRELAGTVRRGLFVQPASGEQYALPAAVETLREARRHPTAECLVLSAADPVLAALALRLEARLGRHPAHLVVLRAGQPVLALEGTRLRTAAPVADDAVGEALRALVAGRRGRRLVVETWDDVPVLGSRWLGRLADLGFHSDGERLTCDGYPGPRPRPLQT
jgi:ATP-dependent Lhr-like helicase